jgi:hypothetical protein
VLVDPASHGGVALRIQVDQQDAPLGSRQRRREIDGRGRLADPTFLICDTDS